jgi:4-amino-4-deoxy-L-arabinose transferase-like glycosyltransferase
VTRFIRNWNDLQANTRKYILIIWFLALLVRLIYALSISLIPADITGVDMDAVEWDYLGWSVAQGHGVVNPHGETTTLRFPGYIFFLGLIYFLFGHHHIAAILIQALIGTATPILLYLIARELLDERLSRIVGIVAAFYPPFINYVGWLMSENLFLLLLNLLIYLTIKFKQNTKWRRLVFIGVVIGLLGLTRGVGLPFLGIIPLYFFIKQKGAIKAKLRPALIIVIAGLIVLTPWTIRNYLNFGKIMLPSSEGGPVLWLTFNVVPISSYYETGTAFAYVDSVGRQNATSEEFYRVLAKHNIFGYTAFVKIWKDFYPDDPVPLSEVDGDKAYGQKAMEVLYQHPTIWVAKSFKQLFKFWHVLDERGRFVNGYGFILPFFLTGFWLLRKRIRDFFPLYLFPLVLYGISVLFFSDARFRMPFEGVWIIVGSVGIDRFLSIFRRVYIGYGILILYFLSNWFLRLHSLEVRLVIRSIVSSLGFHVSEMK